MKIDAITESLDNGHYSRHELKACGCVEEFLESTYCTETERIEKLSLEAKKEPQHLRDCENDLTVESCLKFFFINGKNFMPSNPPHYISISILSLFLDWPAEHL